MTEPNRKRVKTACDLCRKRKLRCDGTTPCRQCRTGNLDCQYRPATNPAHCTTYDLEDGRASEDVTTRVDINPRDQAHGSESTSMMGSGSTETSNDASVEQGLMATPFLFEVGLGEKHGTIETSSMMPNPAAGFDAGFALHTDTENNKIPNFWQMPLLVGQRSIHILLCTADKILRMAKCGGTASTLTMIISLHLCPIPI